jgi:hypothetical protein
MIGTRIAVAASIPVLLAFALPGCGSPMASSTAGPDAQADRGAGEPSAPAQEVAVVADAGLGDAQQEETDIASDSGAADLRETGGPSPDVPSVCQTPIDFPPSSSPPSMCPGVVLKTDAIPLDPADPRWSALYQGCLANYGGLLYPDDCRRLCTDVAVASNALKYIQGINWCTLDCTEPQSPVLSVEYSDTICEPIQPDSGPRDVAKPDAGIDVATDAGMDGAPDRETALDSSEAGSRIQVVLRTVYAYADCMPAVSEDPILVAWTVAITGASGSTALLTQATITVSSKTSSIVQDFTAANPTISLTGGAGSADQRKPVAVVSPNSACSSMCGGATYQLDLVYEVDGQSIAVSQSGSFTCAY